MKPKTPHPTANPQPEGTLTIESSEAADLLTRTQIWETLAPFLTKECTLSEAAETLGIKLSTLSYRIGKLVRLGLLQVVREEARPGRAIKYYRSSASRFFVPFRLTSNVSLEALLETLYAPIQALALRELARNIMALSEEFDIPEIGLNLYPSSEGRAGVGGTIGPKTQDSLAFLNLAKDPRMPAVFSTMGTLRLDRDAAKELQHELLQLFQRYLTREQGQKPGYLLQLGLIPLSGER